MPSDKEQQTTSLPTPSSDESTSVTVKDDSPGQIKRNNLGQFTRGVSGNALGRPKGSKNRTTIIKQAMEEAMTRELTDDVLEIFEQAVALAKAGDRSMIKFVLGDFMGEVRKQVAETEEELDRGKINLTIKVYSGADAKPIPTTTVEGEFTEISGDEE